MAGKLCYGEPRHNSGAGTLRDSKAFAEGIMYRASGTALERPNTGCPHEVGEGAFISWQLGWSTAQSAAGNVLGAVGCCAPAGLVPA